MADRKVRVFIGTRKGGYIAESDTARKKWKVSGPSHAGNDVFHIRADPRTPGDVYAAVNNGWWGPMLFRSKNWGKSWEEVAPPQMTLKKERDASGPEGVGKTPIKNVWHFEPGPANEPSAIFLGVDPASLWRSDDKGASWMAINGLNEHSTRSLWNPGAGGECLHTILIDPGNPRRMYAGISAAGVFRTDDGGAHWTPKNKNVEAGFLPDPFPEVGQCVHKVAMDASDPSTLYRQDHGGIYVSHDQADTWTRVGKSLHDDFGFVVAAPPHRAGEAYFVPLWGETRTIEGGSLQLLRWTDKSKQWKRLVPRGQFPGDFGNHREGLAVDNQDPGGIYFGTTTGQLFWSADDGKRWAQIPYSFPGIHSVTTSSPG